MSRSEEHRKNRKWASYVAIGAGVVAFVFVLLDYFDAGEINLYYSAIGLFLIIGGIYEYSKYR